MRETESTFEAQSTVLLAAGLLLLSVGCSTTTPPVTTDMSAQELLARPQTVDEFLDARRPMVIAHRGFSGKAPENTLTAVRMAIELGADMVEIDVTLTADDHVIVLHDETLERTTNGVGTARETPLETIRTLDAGTWLDPRFAGEPVPTLGEVLDLVKGRILLNIEIKGEVVTDEVRGGIAERVAEEVREKNMVDQVIVSSFDPRALAHLHELAPEIRTASLYNRDLHRALLPSEVAGQVSASAFNVSRHYLTRKMLADAEAHGLPVSVYTVNGTWTMGRLIRRGVSAIFTDRPDRMIPLVERRVRKEVRRR